MGCINGSTRKTLTFYVDFHDGDSIPTIIIAMRKDNLVIGKILLVPLSEQCYQIHISKVIKKERGHTLAFSREALRVGFASIPKIEKVFALIPVHNRLVIKLAQKCGFKKEGNLTNSFLYDGNMEDQVMYSLSKENL
jgi:RimJ/RimL family protein N-acetyltransferase